MAVYVRDSRIFGADVPEAIGSGVDDGGALATAKRFLPASAAAVAATADPALFALDPCNATEPPSELRR
jgi:hypothetical protein